MVRYTAELSKSNRSSCKKCKAKIEKDVIRLGTHVTNADDITMVTWNHLGCFVVPKKVDFRDFLEELEVDGLSADQCAEVTRTLTAAAAGVAVSPAGGKKRSADADQTASPAANKKTKLEMDTEGMSVQEKSFFDKYKAMTVDELKDYCRWNNQMISGTKTDLIKRCVDGEVHGALPACPEVGCKGKLRIESGKVVCPGAYSEDVGTFVRCYFKAVPSSLARTPWRHAAKTEDEMKAEAEFKPSVVDAGSADMFEGLDMETMQGKKTAAERLFQAAKDRGVNVPAVEQEAKVRFGSLIMTNPGAVANELLGLAEQMFGTKAATAAKSEGSKVGTVCPENAGIVAAMSELSEVYFKTGNSQAGNTYRKAVSAIRDYPSRITSGAAISKGKGKVDGIGAKCGQLIDEFLSTGTISKITEKRAQIS